MRGKRFALLCGIVVAVGATAFWWLTRPEAFDAAALPVRTANAENGRTVFFAGGCSSCHATPGQDDVTRLGGGLALKSPFGTFHVPNISSDRRDGIGAWTEGQFLTAMTKGVSPAGEHYYPAFPYTTYQHAKVEDLRDLFAYLRTLPAAQGRAPAHELPFPFTVRRGIGLWKRLYMDARVETAKAGTPEIARGAYLVNALGHCAECHSPRDMFGGIRDAQRFAGGPNPEGEGWVPNITQAALGNWSTDDFVDLLTSGASPEGGKVAGAMAAVVRNTAQLPAADRAAIAAYVKSLPPVTGPKPPVK
ncbi:MAG: cytochrome c [Rhizobiales bacterium]|nr:cytochrome c [Hyphomicrobiales bacterium]